MAGFDSVSTMNLDELISHLQSVRAEHGGHIMAMLVHKNPGTRTYSGVEVDLTMIRECVAEVSVTDLPGYAHKSGWLYFVMPELEGRRVVRVPEAGIL